MIISEVLDAIDNVNSITLESEIDTCESLLNSYDKMLIIEENYNGDDINDFKIFQEGFGDDVKGEMKKSGKNMGTLMKILTALPRFIIAIVKSIKNRLSKKTKDTAKEINDNVKKLSDEQKKGLAQLFPKDRKGKIDAKKIIRGMLGGVAVVGGVIAIGKFKIPKKLAEQTKHVLGKLKGKKSNNPKPTNKKGNVVQNKNNNSDNNSYNNTDKLTENVGSPVDEIDEVDNETGWNKFVKKLNKIITISEDSIEIIEDVESLGKGNDKFKTTIENIINDNKNIDEILKSEEVKDLIDIYNHKYNFLFNDDLDTEIDMAMGTILSIIKIGYDEYKFRVPVDPHELFIKVNDELDKIEKTFQNHVDKAQTKLSRNAYDYFSIYYVSDEGIRVHAHIYNKWFEKFAYAKYYLVHNKSISDSYQQFNEEIENLTEEIKKSFNIEKIDYESKVNIPIDTFVSEFNSYIEKTLDPSKINKQIDDIMTKCKSISEDTCNVEMVTSNVKAAKNEILYMSDIIIKFNEIITDVNEFIKSINEINGTNIVTTDKKLTQVDVSAIRDVK